MELGNPLLMRADDAAGSYAANLAITDALRVGMVQNVSVMGCGSEAAWEDWCRRFFALPEEVRARVDVGLHVTLNAEWSTPSVRFKPRLGPDAVPHLVEADTGFFLPSPAALAAQGWGSIHVSEALAEVQAQLARLRAAELTPVYLDEHMGVGWLPGLRDALVSFADAEGLLAVSRLDLPYVGVHTIESSGEAFADAVATFVRTLPKPGVMVFHPACAGEETGLFFNDDIPRGRVAEERERERRLVCDPSFADALGERNVRLLRYTDVAASSPHKR